MIRRLSTLLKNWSSWQFDTINTRQINFILNYSFPEGLLDNFEKRHKLTTEQVHLISNLLKRFFIVYHKAGRKNIVMPTTMVDFLWHEFILDTRAYHDFCQRAFGKYFHHSPAPKTPSKFHVNSRHRTWWYACIDESIDPFNPEKIPLLFNIDRALNIQNGIYYYLDQLPAEFLKPPKYF